MKKITTGFVIQEYDKNGKCTTQDFIASDQVDWEDDLGDPVGPPSKTEYFPFHMIQPIE